MQVQASLATAIGLNEAIALQQLHWVLQNPTMGKIVDGRKYVYMSYADWRKGHFPFWSEATIQRTLSSLEEKNLIRSRNDLNRAKFDRTKWYSVDLDAVDSLEKTFQQNTKIAEHKQVIDEHSKMKDASSQDERTIPESSLPESSLGGEQNTPPTPSKKERKERKPRERSEIPPAVDVFKKVRCQYPPKETWDLIQQTVGTEPQRLDVWRNCLVTYAARGFNRQAVEGPLEWFSQGGPPQKLNGNGRAIPVPVRPHETWDTIPRYHAEDG